MQTPSARRAQAGFTLIELVVVIAILAILAGVLVPRVSNHMAAARDARRERDAALARERATMSARDDASTVAKKDRADRDAALRTAEEARDASRAAADNALTSTPSLESVLGIGQSAINSSSKRPVNSALSHP